MTAVTVQGVDIIFGDHPAKALALLDQGKDRQTILAETGHVLGVAGANLTIEPGSICVLMGLSGSGKSSLLRAINGLNTITRGSLKVQCGERVIDVSRCSKAELRLLRTQYVAMVFQQFALLPWRTVAENVGFGLELKGVSRKARDATVREKLDMVGLGAWADKYAHELSGGMQQRVGLARAFATDADILLMDEPFSALDPLIRHRLQDELLELQTNLKKTIVFVSHDLDEAMKIGNRIAIMEGGRIVQDATPEEIVLNPADDYVADFVAHMNPLNVLKAASLMRPLAALSVDDGSLAMDQAGLYRLQLDDGVPKAAHFQERRLSLHPYHLDDDPNSVPLDSVVMAPASTPLRTVLALRTHSGAPVALVEDGRLLGVLSDNEIYRGILR